MVIEVFICFGILQYIMVRPKKKGPLTVKRSVAIDPELFAWVQSKIVKKRFSSISHAINEALSKLKENMDKSE